MCRELCLSLSLHWLKTVLKLLSDTPNGSAAGTFFVGDRALNVFVLAGGDLVNSPEVVEVGAFFAFVGDKALNVLFLPGGVLVPLDAEGSGETPQGATLGCSSLVGFLCLSTDFDLEGFPPTDFESKSGFFVVEDDFNFALVGMPPTDFASLPVQSAVASTDFGPFC